MNPQPTSSRPGLAGLLLLLLLVLAGGAAQALSTAVVASDGRYYEVVAGRYDALFPEGTEAAPDAPVLALEWSGERRLVPGSEGDAVDSRAFLVVDGDKVFTVWTSELRENRSPFNLLGFDGSTFSQTIELSGDPLRLKGPLRVALTRDVFTLQPGSISAHDVQRTTLHLVWWEERASRPGLQVLYTPVILVGGEYVGWNPVIPLDTFDLHEPLDEAMDHDELLRSANIQQGSQRSVVLGLPQLGSGRLLGLKVDVLPADLRSLSDQARSHIVLVGRAAPAGPEGLQEISDYARSHIVLVGRAELHRGVRQHIAESVADFLLAQPSFDPDAIEALADAAWREAMSSGASILGNPNRASEPTCGILAIDPATTAATSPHYLQVCMTADRELPDTPRERTHHLLLGPTAEEMLVVWEDDDDSLGFLRSQAGGWAPAQVVDIPDGVSANDALLALTQQLRPE